MDFGREDESGKVINPSKNLRYTFEDPWSSIGSKSFFLEPSSSKLTLDSESDLVDIGLGIGISVGVELGLGVGDNKLLNLCKSPKIVAEDLVDSPESLSVLIKECKVTSIV